MNMARYELIWDYEDGCIEYEDLWGYRILMYKGLELTANKKCTEIWYKSLNEWYWRDEHGYWRRNQKEDIIRIENYLAQRTADNIYNMLDCIKGQ